MSTTSTASLSLSYSIISFSVGGTAEKISGPNGSFAELEITPGIEVLITRLSGNEEADAISLIRQVVKRALEEKLSLSASVDRESNLHFFYLYMGMAPLDFRFPSYIKAKYGMSGYNAIEALKAGELSEVDPRHLTKLREIWTNEVGKIDASDKEIFVEKEYLLGLLNRPHYYIQGQFIPTLFSVLKQDDLKTIPSKAGKEFGKMVMKLSKEGWERWESAIEKAGVFQPFSRIEHMHNAMTKEQRKQLDETLETTL
jgi:hypothetical protein